MNDNQPNHPPLTDDQAEALQALRAAIMSGAVVRRVMSDGVEVTGTVRYYVRSADDWSFPPGDVDVRDRWVGVTGWLGRYSWPVTEVVEDYLRGALAFDRPSDGDGDPVIGTSSVARRDAARPLVSVARELRDGAAAAKDALWNDIPGLKIADARVNELTDDTARMVRLLDELATLADRSVSNVDKLVTGHDPEYQAAWTVFRNYILGDGENDGAADSAAVGDGVAVPGQNDDAGSGR